LGKTLRLAQAAFGAGGKLLPNEEYQEWIDQVNEATRKDPYTNSNRTIEETAEGLFEVFLARRRRLQEYLNQMGDEYLA